MSAMIDVSTTPSPAAADELSASRTGIDPWRIAGRYGAIAVLVVMIVVVSIIEPDTFPTSTNLINVLNQSAISAVIAMGLTFPLVVGEFDLSIGYVASVSGVIAVKLMEGSGFSIPAAVAVAIAAGTVVGLINGILVTGIGMNALVATLGVGTVVVGVNYAICGGLPLGLNDPDAFINLTLGKLLGIPYPVYVMFGLAIVLWLLLNRTSLGLSLQAVGGNRTAAELSGIRVDRIRVAAFAIAGTLAAASGVLLAARTGSSSVDGGNGLLLSSFAAAFFGAAVLKDGQFHIVGTLVGVITVAVGFNAIALIGMATYWQYMFQGSLLVLAVGVGAVARRHRA
jgi:ribose transport system permease protein